MKPFGVRLLWRILGCWLTVPFGMALAVEAGVADPENPRPSSGAAASSSSAGEAGPPPSAQASRRGSLDPFNLESLLGRGFPQTSININSVFGFNNRTHFRENRPFHPFGEAELGFLQRIGPHAQIEGAAALGWDAELRRYVPALEEAFLRLPDLPWGLQSKIGRFRSAFGKSNPMHEHALPWIERPLALQAFLGEEGLSGDGASVSWLVPNPWDHYVELTLETFKAREEFAGALTKGLTHVVHLKDVVDLSDASNLEVGASVATGVNAFEPEEEGARWRRGRTWVEGLDVTYRWRPPGQGLYRSFAWRTEVLAAQRRNAGDRRCAFGGFTSLEYQFARRWTAATRFDVLQPFEKGERLDTRLSAYLTFLQTERIFWRLGYEYAPRTRGHALAIQLNVTLGSHPPHAY